MDLTTDLDTVKAFATALLIGALIGIEREKRKTEEGLTGLTGGLVSSTAVTLSLVQQSRDRAETKAHYTLASGIILAWCIMFVRVIAEILVVNAR